MAMDPRPTSAPTTADPPQVWGDRPRLGRWAHWATFLGFIVVGLSVVGIVLAVLAKRRGEFGAGKALRNAIAVTAFLLLALGAIAWAF